MPFDPSIMPEAVDRYRRERDRYIKLADRIAEICREDICEQNAIRAQVTFRVKTPKSFEGKLKRFSTRTDKTYANVDEIFTGIGDLAGVRIATYRLEDCEEVVKHLLNTETLTGLTGAIEIDSKDTFRDKDGLWTRYRIEDVATPEAYARNPALVHEFYNLRRQGLRAAVPNAAHFALAEPPLRRRIELFDEVGGADEGQTAFSGKRTCPR